MGEVGNESQCGWQYHGDQVSPAERDESEPEHSLSPVCYFKPGECHRAENPESLEITVISPILRLLEIDPLPGGPVCLLFPSP